jgi:tRNA(Ile2) C34 agmatinyltransferase TiaS
MTKEQSHLHKVYRAVYDNVCPKCGNRMPINNDGARACEHCRFTVTQGEMNDMRAAIGPVLAEAVETFESWRDRRSAGG